MVDRERGGELARERHGAQAADAERADRPDDRADVERADEPAADHHVQRRLADVRRSRRACPAISGQQQQRDERDAERDRRRRQAADRAPELRVQRRLRGDGGADRQRRDERDACPRLIWRSQPVVADARVDRQRRVELGRADHLARTISVACSISSGGPSKSSSSWIWRIVRVAQAGLDQRVVGVDHRDLDDVGGGALDDGVDREPLAEAAHLPVAGADLRDLAAAAEQRRHVAVLLGLRDRVLHELRDGGEALQVAVDELLRLLLRDLQPVGEAVGAEAVDDPVVDHLRLASACRRRAAPAGRSKTALGGLGVDVLAAHEDVAQHLLVGDVGEHAQLDLAVVDAEQDVPGLGDEAGADLAAGLGPDRDVLQVRVDAGEAAGGGLTPDLDRTVIIGLNRGKAAA